MSKGKAGLVLGSFVALVVVLGIGLTLNPREVPSPLINKPAPLFSLKQLHAPEQMITSQDMLGKVWVLNVWASWCAACRVEHPVLLDLAAANVVPLIGLNYKDERKAGITWLKQLGDPYVLSAFDADGRVGIDFGVYGVPETFVIDKRGVIRFKQIGPVSADVVQKKIIPLVQELNRV